MEKKISSMILISQFYFLFFCPFGFSKEKNDSNQKEKKIYPKKTKFIFEGAEIEGEVRNANEFYFQHKPEEKFDSLIKRRKNFHRQMLKEVMLSQ